MSKSYVFYISGITCSACSQSIESGLRKEFPQQFKTSRIDVTTKTDPKKMTVVLDDSAVDEQQRMLQIKGIIEDLGFNCESSEVLPEEKKAYFSHVFKGIVGCSAGIILLITMLVTGGLPLVWMIPVAGLSVGLTLLLGADSIREAWKKGYYSKSLTMDTLFAISTLTVIGVSIAALFIPWLPIMFEAGLLIYGFRHVGLAIEETLLKKISSVRFKDRAPKTVKVITAQGDKEISLDEVKPGDTLLLSPGEIIPVDGMCLNESSLYNTIESGAYLPSQVYSGESVLAGMQLTPYAHPLRLRVTHAVSDSYLAMLDASIENSILEKAPLEIKTESILGYFIPGVLLFALGAGLLVSFFFPPAVAISCFLSVLMSACPCTLGLIIPLTVKIGMYKVAEHGIRFKNATFLQQAEQIDTVVFDLNGTLTEGMPEVKGYEPIGQPILSDDEFFNLCASLEQKSSHPVGQAINAYAAKKTILERCTIVPDNPYHSGIEATVDGGQYIIGSTSLMQQKGIDIAATASKELQVGESLVLVAHNYKLIGYFVVRDPLREHAVETVQALTKMGKKVHLCTGADEKTAKSYAIALGIKEELVRAACPPVSDNAHTLSKTGYIKSLKGKGYKVAMVGDAGNDAPAIAASDLGIVVLSKGSDTLSQQYAGAEISRGSLLPIISAFTISKQTVSTIKQNLLMSLSYNSLSLLLAVGLPLVLGFSLPPVAGLVFMMLQASTILLSVYLFKRQPLPHLQKAIDKSTQTMDSKLSAQIIKTRMPENNLTQDKDPACLDNCLQTAFPFWNRSLFQPKEPATDCSYRGLSQ